MADYYSESQKYPAPREPELWLIENGNGAVLMFPDRVYAWVSPQNYNTMDVCEDMELVETQSVQSQAVDGNILLKAIAIAQRPELAVDLIKE